MAPYLGDFIEDATLHFIWTSLATTGASVTRTTDGTVAVWKDNGTTQSVEGVTDAEDFDGFTGVHAVTIDLSANAFYAVGADYTVMLTGATIDSVTVNKVLAHFSIENRLGIVAQAWDRVLTGATHNIATSAGKRLRQIDAAFEVHAGTAQAGTENTITFDTGAEATNGIYDGDRVIIVGGTGVEEHGIVISYVGSTRVATMAENWVITPDNTSEFEIVPASVDIKTIKHVVQTALDVGGAIGTAGAGLTNVGGMSTSMKAEMNVEAKDVLFTDTHAELTSPPAKDAPLADKINWMFMYCKNQLEQNSGTNTLRADDSSTSVATQTITQSGGTTTREKAT